MTETKPAVRVPVKEVKAKKAAAKKEVTPPRRKASGGWTK